jgi:hypothetical protein
LADSVPNEVQSGPLKSASLKPSRPLQWAAGRWSEKPSLKFTGTQSGQHLLLSKEESSSLNLPKSFSILIWFRVDEFSTRYQTLISKGDFGFRIARFQDTSGLAFAINRWAKEPTADYAIMAEVDARDYAVDDGNWHMVAGVVDAESDTVTLSIFVDGALRGSTTSQSTMTPNEEPVIIGGNSFFLTDKPRRNANGSETIVPSRHFCGDIDEVAILARVLTEQEIKDAYESAQSPSN